MIDWLTAVDVLATTAKDVSAESTQHYSHHHESAVYPNHFDSHPMNLSAMFPLRALLHIFWHLCVSKPVVFSLWLIFVSPPPPTDLPEDQKKLGLHKVNTYSPDRTAVGFSKWHVFLDSLLFIILSDRMKYSKFYVQIIQPRFFFFKCRNFPILLSKCLLCFVHPAFFFVFYSGSKKCQPVQFLCHAFQADIRSSNCLLSFAF